jgi:tetratricopeptide (TPR) repeat protein
MRIQHHLCVISILLPLLACGRDEPKQPPVKVRPERQPVNVEQALSGSKAGQRLLPKIKLKKAETALIDGKFEEALKLYEEMGQETQLTAEARSQLFAGQAEALYHLRRFDESVSMWERVLALRPDDPFAHQNLALVLAESGQLREAVTRLERLFQIDPDVLAARVDLVNLLKKLDAPQEKLIEAAAAFDASRKNVDRRLEAALAQQQGEEIVRLLGYLVEVPSEVLAPAQEEQCLTHATATVREKAGLLAVRTEKGRARMKELVAKEADPAVRVLWQKALAAEAGGASIDGGGLTP